MSALLARYRGALRHLLGGLAGVVLGALLYRLLGHQWPSAPVLVTFAVLPLLGGGVRALSAYGEAANRQRGARP